MMECRELVKRYGKTLAVDHLSLRVEAGEVHGFVGPNGAIIKYKYKIFTRKAHCLPFFMFRSLSVDKYKEMCIIYHKETELSKGWCL